MSNGASRNKGKRGEREVVTLFKDFGFDARRTAQVDGGLTADVLVKEIPTAHIEVKRHASMAVFRFVDQAVEDKKEGQTPVVFIREDGGGGAPNHGWYVVTPAKSYVGLLRGAYEAAQIMHELQAQQLVKDEAVLVPQKKLILPS